MPAQFLSPQYHEIAQSAVSKTGLEKGNLGLIFDRYLEIWDENFGKTKEIFSRLHNFSKLFEHIDPDFLLNIHARQKKIVSHMGKNAAASLELETAWRLACGLGYDHPIENGFTTDYLNGIPYIPASTVKGLCRKAAESETDQDGIGGTGDRTWFPKDFYELFGSYTKDTDGPGQDRQRGDMVFLDAFPQKLSAVEVDVMNVHHNAYYHSELYQSGKQFENSPAPTPSKGAPMQTENPVPVFFLTIGAGSWFVFRFFSRSKNPDHINITKAALLEGLSFYGIGAKTAAGYGRFKPGASKGSKWLDTAIQDLCKKNNEPKAENILRGKALCNEWQEIADPELKQEALDEIKHRWKGKSITPTKRVINMYQKTDHCNTPHGPEAHNKQ